MRPGAAECRQPQPEEQPGDFTDMGPSSEACRATLPLLACPTTSARSGARTYIATCSRPLQFPSILGIEPQFG